MATANPLEIFEVAYLFQERKNLHVSFNSIQKFSEFLQEFDRLVLRSISYNAAPEYELEDVQFGSIRARVAQLLKAVPDDAIKDLEWKKLVGTLLVRVKYDLIAWLEGEREILTRRQLDALLKRIKRASRQLVAAGMIVGEVNLFALVILLEKAQTICSNLKVDERFEYKSNDGVANLSIAISINKPKLLYELGQQQYENTALTVLKFKRIELLDDKPKWTFLKEGERGAITASITDEKWLDDYHACKITILPEDRILADLKIRYTDNGSLYKGEAY